MKSILMLFAIPFLYACSHGYYHGGDLDNDWSNKCWWDTCCDEDNLCDYKKGDP